MIAQILKNQISIDQLLHLIPLALSLYFTVQVWLQKSISLPTRKLLVFLLFQFTIIFLISTAIKFHISILEKILMPFFIPAFLAISPTCYLYLKSLTDEDFKLKRKDYYHFIPAALIALLTLIASIAFLTMGKGDKNLKLLLFNILYFLMVGSFVVVGFTQFVIYTVWGIRKYKMHQSTIKNYFSNIENIKLDWMKWFLLSYILFLTSLIVSTLFQPLNGTLGDLIYLGATIAFIGFIGYHVVKQVDIFAQIKSEKNQSEKTQVIEHSLHNPQQEIQTQTEDISAKSLDSFFQNPERLKELSIKIISLVENKKMYLNGSLTIEDIAKELNTNKKYISFVINQVLNTNFYNLIHDYRIQEAQKLLSGPESNQYTIEGIGNLVGFRSRSTFILAFKKVTGKTPSEYKQSMLN